MSLLTDALMGLNEIAKNRVRKPAKGLLEPYVKEAYQGLLNQPAWGNPQNVADINAAMNAPILANSPFNMDLVTLPKRTAEKVKTNAKQMYQDAKEIPGELKSLFSPEMGQQVNQAMMQPGEFDKEKGMQMAMDFLQTSTPVGGLLAHTVYHGSPHKFNKFDMSKIGTGEGAQAYGHGLYFAEAPEVARHYLKAGGSGKMLTVTQPGGKELYNSDLTDLHMEAIKLLERGKEMAGQFPHNTAYYAKQLTKDDAVKSLIDEMKDAKIGYKSHETMYKVDIPDEAIPKMLDWDAPLSKQPQNVIDAIQGTRNMLPPNAIDDMGGDLSMLYDMSRNPDAFLADLAAIGGRQDFGESLLRQQGIPGIRYKDAMSRGTGAGTSNFVLFDDQLPRILEVNGQPTGLLSWADEAKKVKKAKK